MATMQGTKPLPSRTVGTMKPGDKIKADTGENIGLRVKCGASLHIAPAELSLGHNTLKTNRNVHRNAWI